MKIAIVLAIRRSCVAAPPQMAAALGLYDRLRAQRVLYMNRYKIEPRFCEIHPLTLTRLIEEVPPGAWDVGPSLYPKLHGMYLLAAIDMLPGQFRLR